jgi:transcriptional regulator with XRE-family HTH domain
MVKGKTTKKSFAEVLREIRQEKGLSQEALADKAGLHRTYISQVERGLKSPSLRSLEQIAQALGVPASALLKRMET